MGAVIPLRDLIPSRTVPFVNYTMIGLCTVVWLLQLADPELLERLAMVPARVLGDGENLTRLVPHVVQDWLGNRRIEMRPVAVVPALVPDWLTLLTCTFLHGGWMHFLGNMWFLYIFGDNVEDRLGHAGYALFYLAAGVVASAAHLAAGPGSTVPTVGASGAIAGVMGAYLHLYPKSKVLALVPLGFILTTLLVPASLFLVVWFGIQLLQGTLSSAGEGGGVAWWAHIGGFALGYVVALVLGRTPAIRPAVQERRPYTSRRAVLGRFDRRL